MPTFGQSAHARPRGGLLASFGALLALLVAGCNPIPREEATAVVSATGFGGESFDVAMLDTDGKSVYNPEGILVGQVTDMGDGVFKAESLERNGFVEIGRAKPNGDIVLPAATKGCGVLPGLFHGGTTYQEFLVARVDERGNVRKVGRFANPEPIYSVTGKSGMSRAQMAAVVNVVGEREIDPFKTLNIDVHACDPLGGRKGDLSQGEVLDTPYNNFAPK